MDADVIVVGAGLAGLVATAELADAGRHVLVVDQESPANLGGQAFWSFGGLLFADSPEQRRMGVRDSADLLWQDWQGSAGFEWDLLSCTEEAMRAWSASPPTAPSRRCRPTSKSSAPSTRPKAAPTTPSAA